MTKWQAEQRRTMAELWFIRSKKETENESSGIKVESDDTMLIFVHALHRESSFS